MPKARKKQPAARPRARCRRCDKAIRIPSGWGSGSAVRRHYWRYHRDVMMAGRGGA